MADTVSVYAALMDRGSRRARSVLLAAGGGVVRVCGDPARCGEAKTPVAIVSERSPTPIHEIPWK